MEPFRLRMKIGAHEFEAEGDQATVERQFALWREMVSASPPQAASPPPLVDPAAGAVVADVAKDAKLPEGRKAFDKVFRHDGRVVSLSMAPPGGRLADAALLLMLGQQAYNNETLVTGNQLVQGLSRSGLPTERVDRVFGEHMNGNVLRIGSRRAVRYRLTNPGVAAATKLANDMAATVP